MSSVTLLLAAVVALLALATAQPPPPPHGGPHPPHGGPGGRRGPGGRGGKGPGGPHGSHECDEEDQCGLPEWVSRFDNDTQAKLEEVWKNYVNGTNCTEELAQQDTIIKAAFLAEMDAKAANLTATQGAVYDQFKAAFIAFDALSAEDKAALQALMPHGGKGDWGHRQKCRKGPKGPKSGSHELS